MRHFALVCLRFSFSKRGYKAFLGFFILLFFSSASTVIAKPQFVSLKEFLERYSQKHGISVSVGQGIDLKTRVNMASMPRNPEDLLRGFHGGLNLIGLFSEDGRLEEVKLYKNSARERIGLRLNSKRQKMKKQKLLSKRKLIENYFQRKKAQAVFRRDQLAAQMKRNVHRQFLASSLILNARKRQPVIRAERTSQRRRLNDEAGLQDSKSPSDAQVALAGGDSSANYLDVANGDPVSQQESSGGSINSIGQTVPQTGGDPLSTTSADNSGTQPQAVTSNVQETLPLPNQQQNNKNQYQMQSLAQANAMRNRYQFNPMINFQFLSSLATSREIDRILSGTASVRAP